MPCYYPLTAYQTEDGEIVFVERGKIRRNLTLPCGRCIGCKLERSRQWAVRCVHESQMHDFSCFVTLTYTDESLPADSSLRYRDFQLFMKKLRKLKGSVRFYMCGEYGEKFFRPHFHACLFGCSFEDRYYWRTSDSGFRLDRSQTLERLWGRGNCEIGDVTFESAAYIARYVVKKITGPMAEEYYKIVDPETGEIFNRRPEFTRMSLKPGIGATWYEKYKNEVFPMDRVVMRGRQMKPPKAYTRILKRTGMPVDSEQVWGLFSYISPVDLMSDEVEHARYMQSLELISDCTPDRLAVRERVCKAKIKSLQRNIE